MESPRTDSTKLLPQMVSAATVGFVFFVTATCPTVATRVQKGVLIAQDGETQVLMVNAKKPFPGTCELGKHQEKQTF